MLQPPHPLRLRWSAWAVILLVLCLTAGCGASRYPVEGRVLLNSQPLKGKEGSVVLKPDASKDNTSTASAVGAIQRDGSFSVFTNGKPGAPLGWYKVLVSATEPNANPNEDPRQLLNKIYRTEADTPLSIEVVANPSPGSYDVRLVP